MKWLVRTFSLSMFLRSSGHLDVSRGLAVAVGLMEGSSATAAPDSSRRRFLVERAGQWHNARGNNTR